MMTFLGRREYGQRLPCADAHPHTTLAGALSVYDESRMKEGRPAAPMIGDQIPVSVRQEHLLVPEFLPHPPTGSRMAEGSPMVSACRRHPGITGSQESRGVGVAANSEVEGDGDAARARGRRLLGSILCWATRTTTQSGSCIAQCRPKRRRVSGNRAK